MPPFLPVLEGIMILTAVVGIPVGAYAAIVATRAIWVKGEPGKAASGELEALHERVDELEAQVGHLAELEERLDFAERMLARPDDSRKLAGS